MAALPDTAVLDRPATIRLVVSPAMVTRFATLTGDRSSLHVSEAFARRSAYRQPVVHGMLPVSFLALLPNLHVPGFRTVPTGLTGRFVSPVFAGDARGIRYVKLRAKSPQNSAPGTSGELFMDVAEIRVTKVPLSPIGVAAVTGSAPVSSSTAGRSR